MARVKVSKVPVEARVSEVSHVLRSSEKDAYSKEAYAYACGYLESTLVRVLDLLPPGKRELFLASLEKQVRPKPTGACEMNRLTKVPFKDHLTTDGSGYWSDIVVTVQTTHLQVPYINEEETFGELCVYFNTNTWRIDRHGLIYTDQKWLNELCDALSERGYDTSDISYSEQGMQGDDYVSLDVGENFIASWIKIHKLAEV